MFEVIFEADNGKKFVFGRSGGNYYSMNIGDGMEVALGTSQGFSQIGETVQTRSVGGRNIDVTGEVYGDIQARKNALRNACAPMSAGRLVFQGKCYIRVYVKAAPTFSAKAGDGRFKMRFFAPFPFYTDMEERCYSIGDVTKEFRFPVNYSRPHRFGTRSAAKAVAVINDGDAAVAFRTDILASSNCKDVTITNLGNRDFLKINGELEPGDRVAVYRGQDDELRAELTRAGVTTDILSRIDEESTLFSLPAGQTTVAATEDNGGIGLMVRITFQCARAAIYEDQFV